MIVLHVAEPDYQYGLGELTLRVQHVDVAHPLRYEDENWYPVHGVQLGCNGTEIGEREALIRGSRLPKSLLLMPRRSSGREDDVFGTAAGAKIMLDVSADLETLTEGKGGHRDDRSQVPSVCQRRTSGGCTRTGGPTAHVPAGR